MTRGVEVDRQVHTETENWFTITRNSATLHCVLVVQKSEVRKPAWITRGVDYREVAKLLYTSLDHTLV